MNSDYFVPEKHKVINFTASSLSLPLDPPPPLSSSNLHLHPISQSGRRGEHPRRRLLRRQRLGPPAIDGGAAQLAGASQAGRGDRLPAVVPQFVRLRVQFPAGGQTGERRQTGDESSSDEQELVLFLFAVKNYNLFFSPYK